MPLALVAKVDLQITTTDSEHCKRAEFNDSGTSGSASLRI